MSNLSRKMLLGAAGTGGGLRFRELFTDWVVYEPIFEELFTDWVVYEEVFEELFTDWV
jgi:hypothetical protein